MRPIYVSLSIVFLLGLGMFSFFFPYVTVPTAVVLDCRCMGEWVSVHTYKDFIAHMNMV